MSDAVAECGDLAREVLHMPTVASEFRAFHESKATPPYRRVMRIWMLFSLLHWLRRLEAPS